MADVKISQLPASTTPLDGTEVLPIVQSATTKQVSVANLTAGRAVSALSLSLTNALPVTSGGTGIQTAAQGSLLSATGANTFSATVTPTLGLAGTSAGTLGLSGLTSGVVTLATASSAGTWTFTLPTSGGTNGYILTTNGSGVSSWTNPTALGIDLDVGTTAITGGTTGRVLYDNAGVLGEYSVTGTGTTAVLSTSPTFTTGLTTPLAIGGTTASSSLTLQSTSGVGTSDSILFKVGNNGATTAATIDTAGNLGLGVTPSAWSNGYKTLDVGSIGAISNSTNVFGVFTNTYVNSASNYIYKTANYATMYLQNAGGTGQHQWHIAPTGSAGSAISFTQAMTLTAAGDLGIGVSSPGSRLQVEFISNPPNDNGAGANAIRCYTNITQNQDVGGAIGLGGKYSTSDSSRVSFAQLAGRKENGTDGNLSGYMQFCTLNSVGTMAEKARLTSDGNLLVGTTDSGEQTGVGIKLIPDATHPSLKTVTNSATGGYSTYLLYNTNATNNGYRAYTKLDGGFANYSANDVNLSDERLKKDIAPAGNYLSKICAIPVKTYLYKDQSDDELNLGVIAQDVLTIAPELVDKDGWIEKAPDGSNYLSIYQTDLQYALMKCIQELAAKVSALEARI